MSAPRDGRRRRTAGAALLVVWLACACDPGPDLPRTPEAAAEISPPTRSWQPGSVDLTPATALAELDRFLREDNAQQPDPADGGGRAWLDLPDGDDGSVQAGARRRWSFVYEAGPLGIAEGGSLHFGPPAFWEWSAPQVHAPTRPGFVTAATEVAGVRLELQAADQTVIATLREAPLPPGATLRLTYGAGPAEARGDAYAESESSFRFWVDGNGDGGRAALADPPTIAVHAGPAARLVALLPSTARPGESVRLSLAVLDARGNRGPPFAGRLSLQLPATLAGPAEVELPGEAGGCATVELLARSSGVARVVVSGPGGLTAESNPLFVEASAPRVLWADLHGHSALSDGSGTPDEYFAYARDVAALDVVALTDHDHWGLPFIDRTPALWERIAAATARHHEPGRFVTLLGWEWTSWVHGHRHVLLFEDRGELLSSLHDTTATPAGLWSALAGRPALTIGHHVAGGPVALNWSFAPDPVLEPLVEIMSVHGSSEAVDSPRRIYSSVPGHFARDALDAGYRFGFLGSGDSHDGHPGLAHLASPRGHGGLTGVLAESCERLSVLEALRARRTWATSGPRILLLVRLGERPAGADVPAGSAELSLSWFGTDLLESVELIRSGVSMTLLSGAESRELHHRHLLTDLTAGDYLYLRVTQRDGGLAWSSPFFVR